MKKLLAFIGLFFVADFAVASVVYYPPPYYNPYFTTPYSNPYYPYYRRPVVAAPAPTNINSCPLQPSYYDANGNWVAPQRVCPSTTPQVNIKIGG